MFMIALLHAVVQAMARTTLGRDAKEWHQVWCRRDELPLGLRRNFMNSSLATLVLLVISAVALIGAVFSLVFSSTVWVVCASLCLIVLFLDAMIMLPLEVKLYRMFLQKQTYAKRPTRRA